MPVRPAPRTTKAPHLGAVGLQPYESRNIRLSSALCAFGFELRINSEPATVIVDYDTQRPIVVFWHDMTLPDTSKIHQQLPTLTANHLGLWWANPTQFTVDGYDDALRAIRKVFEMREWLIKVVKGAIHVPHDARNVHNSVATESLHIASIIKACGIDLIAFDKGTFVFGSKAAPIAAEIAHAQTKLQTQPSGGVESRHAAGSDADGPRRSSLNTEPHAVPCSSSGSSAPPAQPRPLTSEGADLCTDWMSVALKYRDWLQRIVRSKNCIPMIEKRDGERCLRISSQMPKTLRREFTRRF